MNSHTEELVAALKDAITGIPSEEPIDYGYTGNSDDARKYGIELSEFWLANKIRAALKAFESTPEPPTAEPEGMEDAILDDAEYEKVLKGALDGWRLEIEMLRRDRIGLKQRLATAEQANTPLWEYVWAMESVNVSMDEGGLPSLEQIARINAAQERLKAIRALPTTQQKEEPQ